MWGSAPTVSVVIPALDEAAYLPRTLSSFARQDGTVAFEVVVVDGGSTDGTREIAREFDVQLIDAPGTGIGAARHVGAQHATGEWLAFVDAYRGKAKQTVVNRVFPHIPRPVLPGFNFFIDAAVYETSGGFPDVPNEDTAYSHKLAREYEIGYHPEVLVETSGRRFGDDGLTGALSHYLRLDSGRVRARC